MRRLFHKARQIIDIRIVEFDQGIGCLRNETDVIIREHFRGDEKLPGRIRAPEVPDVKLKQGRIRTVLWKVFERADQNSRFGGRFQSAVAIPLENPAAEDEKIVRLLVECGVKLSLYRTDPVLPDIVEDAVSGIAERFGDSQFVELGRRLSRQLLIGRIEHRQNEEIWDD